MRTRWQYFAFLTWAVMISGCGIAKPAASAPGSTVSEVCDIVATLLGVDRKELRSETSLEDLSADELDFVELVMELEEHFDISIPDDAAERLLETEDWKQGIKNVTMAKLARLVDDLRRSPKAVLARPRQQPSGVESQARQVKVYLNPLVLLLSAAEKQKGRQLTREEVLAIRDGAEFVMMSPEQSQKFYDSLDSNVSIVRIDPNRVWEEWQTVRQELR